MDKQEYELAKAKIVQEYGQPENDYDRAPMNESARRIAELHTVYMIACRKAKKLLDREAGQKQAPQGLEEINAAVPKDSVKEYLAMPVPPVFIPESDLIAFNKWERAVLIDHFEHLNLTHTELARRHGVSQQKVTGLLNMEAVGMLQTRVFARILPVETYKGLLQALASKNHQVALRLAEHFGIIKGEETTLNLANSVIQDPEAIKMLKELGDKLADSKKIEETQ